MIFDTFVLIIFELSISKVIKELSNDVNQIIELYIITIKRIKSFFLFFIFSFFQIITELPDDVINDEDNEYLDGNSRYNQYNNGNNNQYNGNNDMKNNENDNGNIRNNNNNSQNEYTDYPGDKGYQNAQRDEGYVISILIYIQRYAFLYVSVGWKNT